MGDGIISNCIQHKDTRYIQVRCDYLQLYKGNEHKAKIVRILESWTDSKREQWYKVALDKKEQKEAPPEPDFWITMSHRQFQQFMYETASVDTIKSNIAELVSKDKHIERRVNPDNPYGPPQYRIIVGSIQKGLNKLGTPPLIPSLPSLEEDTPPGKPTPPLGGETPCPPLENQPLGEGGKTATSKSNGKSNGESITASPTLDANASLPPSLQEKGNHGNTDNPRGLSSGPNGRDSSSSVSDRNVSPHSVPVREAAERQVVDKSQTLSKETNGQPVTLPGVPSDDSAAGGNSQEPSKRVTRKPRAQRDEVTQKRITQVYDAMDEFKRKLMGDETATFQRTKKGDAAIVELLKQNPTPSKLLKVMYDMWNESDRNGDHFWRKRMKPHTICSEYESRIMALEVVETPATPKTLAMPPRPKTREELRAEAY